MFLKPGKMVTKKRKVVSSFSFSLYIYPAFGTFAVKANSAAKTFSDLVGKKVARGTKSSGLTQLAQYVTNALGLDRDQNFDAVYLERACHGASMALNDEVAAKLVGGVGWSNSTKIMQTGGRLVGLSN